MYVCDVRDVMVRDDLSSVCAMCGSGRVELRCASVEEVTMRVRDS